MQPRYSEDMKTELIGGIIYDMSPGGFDHATINGNIYRTISRQLKDSLCLPYMENLNLYFADGERLIPDILIVCDRKHITPKGYNGVPKFVAETLSPSTAKRDRGIKMDLYCKKGIEEYWIIDPRARSLEIYHLQDGRYVVQDVLILEEDPDEEGYNVDTEITLRAFPGVTVRLGEIFADML